MRVGFYKRHPVEALSAVPIHVGFALWVWHRRRGAHVDRGHIAALELAGGPEQSSAPDLIPYTYPALRDHKRLKYRSVCLGSYIPWDPRKQSQLIMDELGWQGEEVEGMPPGLYPYEKIECYMQGVRDYIKHLKRGYGRVTQMTALDVRYGRMGLPEANQYIEEFEGRRPPSLDYFLEYLNLTEAEFNAIVQKTVVAPHQPDFQNIKLAPRLHDLHLAYRARVK